MKLDKLILAGLITGSLAACGGGGGSASPAAPSAPIPVPVTDLIVSGTAATGKAIAGGTINAKCQVGTGSATSIADGSYRLLVAGGTLPCVIEITNPADGSKLHTVVTGSGSSAIANITPLTEMVAARALGNEPGVFFAAFDPTVAARTITTTSVKAAQTDVGSVLSGKVDTASLADFIATPLKAATPDNLSGGDVQDKMLDALRAKLGGAQLTQVVAALAHTASTTDIKLLVANLESTPPTANAGVDQSVVAGTQVTLDGSTSTVDLHQTLTYAWSLTTKPTGSSAILSSSTSAKPTFIADIAGTYVAALVVNSGTVNSGSDAVSIVASVANSAPVANAGTNQSVTTNTLVLLDGSASSDANGDQLTYQWSITGKPAASTAQIANATLAKPTILIDVAGSYVVSLVVNDGKLNSPIVTVTVTAAKANAAPAANAGVNQNVTTNTLVLLDGSASSDANGDQLTYQWSIASAPAGSAAKLSDATLAKPTFLADVAGNYVLALIVSDGKLNSQVVNVTVTAAVANVAPVANAGKDLASNTSKLVQLDGSASLDANGDALTYTWRIISSPMFSNNVLTGANTVKPSFTPTTAGDYVVALIVNDGKVSSTEARVTVSVVAVANTLPPNAGLILGYVNSFYIFDETTMNKTLSSSSSACSIISQDVRPDGMLIGVGQGSDPGLMELDPYQPLCIKKFLFPEAMTGLAIAQDGTYWTTSYFSGKLYHFSQAGLQLEKITLSGSTNLVQAIDFAPDGSLYGVAFPGILVKINAVSGNVATIATLADNVYDIDIDSKGELRMFAQNSANIYKYDLNGTLLSTTAVPGVCGVSCGFKSISYYMQTPGAASSFNKSRIGRRGN